MNDRLDILSDDGSLVGGFHCGDCIEVLLGTEWIQTRVEYSDDWYLVGLYRSGEIPEGLQIRASTLQEDIHTQENDYEMEL